MNLDDLRAELNARANDLDAHPHGRMDGIRAKVAQRRRRKTVAVVAGVVLIVGAVIGIPALSRLASGPEPIDEPDGPFPERVNGDTLIAQATGDKGDGSVTLTFTPDDTDFLLDFDCNPEASVRATFNGKRLQTDCGIVGYDGATADLLVGSLSPAEHVSDRWAETYGVRPGAPVTVRLTATGGGRASTGTIGAAVYEMTGERVEESGVALTEEFTRGGRTYRLGDDGYDIASTGEARASVSTPAVDQPVLVRYGGWGTDLRKRIDGGPVAFLSFVPYSVFKNGKAHTVTVDKTEDRPGARAFVAYYTPVS